jgi:hypothetical protein
MRGMRHAVLMGEMRSAYKTVIVKLERRGPLGGIHRW